MAYENKNQSSRRTSRFSVETIIAELEASFWPLDLDLDSDRTIQASVNGVILSAPCQIRKIGPIGAELIVQNIDGEKFSSHTFVLDLKMENRTLSFNAILVHSKKENDQVIIGVRWCESPQQKSNDNRRAQERWICSDLFSPTCIASNPAGYKDFISFRIVDISKSGFRLITSLKHKNVTPGLIVNTIITFPMIGAVNSVLKIKWTKIITYGSRNVLSCGGEILAPTIELSQAIQQYAYQFAPQTSLTELTASGSKNSSGKEPRTVYSFVRSEKDYQDVLKLRAQFYKSESNTTSENSEKKLPGILQELELADVFDTSSRILIARQQGECVGTLRLAFPENVDSLGQSQFVKIPEDFPPNSQIVEVSQICIHPAHLHTDLLLDMIRQCTIVMIQTNRPWWVGAITDDLKGLFLVLGARDCQLSYQAPSSNKSVNMNVIKLNVFELISGKNVSPFIWAFIVADMLSFASEKRVIDPSRKTSIKIVLYRMLKPFLDLYIRFRKRNI